jgi:hypothetical protein
MDLHDLHRVVDHLYVSAAPAVPACARQVDALMR